MIIKRKVRFLFLAFSLIFFSQRNSFSAVTLADCVAKGGEAVEERGYTKCSGGDYDDEPILSPDFEEEEEVIIPLSETQK
jgi:hypothetical protein